MEIMDQWIILVHEKGVQAGYEHYEISNFAQESRYMSQHNLHYWNLRHFLGLGSFASGFLGNIRYRNPAWASYKTQLQEGKKLKQEEEEIQESDILLEKVMLGLRQNKIVSFENTMLEEEQKKLFQNWADQGLIELISLWNIRATLKTWLFLDYLIQEFYYTQKEK